jgi:hypothetical protein
MGQGLVELDEFKWMWAGWLIDDQLSGWESSPAIFQVPTAAATVHSHPSHFDPDRLDAASGATCRRGNTLEVSLTYSPAAGPQGIFFDIFNVTFSAIPSSCSGRT